MSYTVTEDQALHYTTSVRDEYNADDAVEGYIGYFTAEEGQFKRIEFLNQLSPVTGSLDLSKVVEGSGADPDKEFDITVTFDRWNDDYSTILLDGMLFSGSGRGVVSLKAGESVSFSEIPLDTGYTITERSYKDEYYHSNHADDTVTGTVIDSSPISITFTNTRRPPGGGDIEEPPWEPPDPPGPYVPPPVVVPPVVVPPPVVPPVTTVDPPPVDPPPVTPTRPPMPPVPLNPDGTPTGEWIWNPDTEEWEFFEYPPPLLGLPQTGVGVITLGGTLLLGYTMLNMGAAYVSRKRRRARH